MHINKNVCLLSSALMVLGTAAGCGQKAESKTEESSNMQIQTAVADIPQYDGYTLL